MSFFENTTLSFIKEPANCLSNYWLNAVIIKNKKDRDLFLYETNLKKIMTRPIWTLMNNLPMYENCQCTDLSNSKWLEQRVVNIPSSTVIS